MSGGVALGARVRWGVAAASALLVTGTFLFLIRVPSGATRFTMPEPVAVSRPTVKIARPDVGDTLMKEEAELRDLQPMFLPTERNAALPEPRLEPGRTFLDNEGIKLSFGEAEVQIGKDLPPVTTLNGKPVEQAMPRDVFGADAVAPGLLGLGRAETAIAPLEPRGGFVEVTALADGRNVLSVTIPIEARAPGDRAWAPLEMMAAVDRAGLAGPLVVTEGSRVEEVDAHFRNFLSQTLRIGERLTPGFYRIVVSP